MSKISRRVFLKGAGMTALAVAAAGMMAGCSKEDIVPDPGKKKVAVVTLGYLMLYPSVLGIAEVAPNEETVPVEKLEAVAKAKSKTLKTKTDVKIQETKDIEDAVNYRAAVIESGCDYYVIVDVE